MIRDSRHGLEVQADRMLADHGLSFEVVGHEPRDDMGIYIIHGRVSCPGGRRVDCLTAIRTTGLEGDPLAGAIRDAVTLAKARGAVSALAMSPNARQTPQDGPGEAIAPAPVEKPAPVPRTAPRPNGAGSPVERRAIFDRWLAAEVEKWNSSWLVRVTREHGNVKAKAELFSSYQIAGHMMKWARGQGYSDMPAPADVKPGERFDWAFAVWSWCPAAAEEETLAYCRKQWSAEAKKLAAKHAKAPAEPANVAAGEGPDSNVWPDGRE